MILCDYKSLVYFCTMQMKSLNILLIMILLIIGKIQAQQKWDLRQCVDYALTNNISVKQTDLSAKIQQLNYKQNKQALLPALNFTGGPGFNSGRNQDPTSFSLITQSYTSANIQLQSSVDIFNWFSKKHTIAASKYDVDAANASTDKLKDDIALTVANSYLQILLSKEQEKITLVQLQQSQSQLSNTLKLVKAGSLPELNAAELEAQVARDSANYIAAQGNVLQNTLNLKAYMSLDAGTPFEVQTPPVEFIPVENLAELQPESVYLLALANLPQQRVNDLKLKSAQKSVLAAKANMLPTFSAYLSLASGYNSRNQDITGSSFITPPIGKVNVSGVDYTVFPVQPYETYSYSKAPFFRQINENFRQSVGVSISVPILNNGRLRNAWDRNKLNVKNLEYQKEGDNLKLKQDIYQAFNLASIALQKFNASKKTVETAERTYSFSQKRYAVGMLTTLELLTNQNNLLRAKLEYIQNQFDYVFKMKVLEYYKGQGLKL